MIRAIFGGGLSFMTLLFLVFLVMKLAEVGAVASWSWLTVTSPLWVGPAFLAIIAVIVFLVIYG
jgi:hypothetical protein